MGDSNSVMVRFGGDAAGLDAAAAVAKAQLNAVNAELKKLAKEALATGGANDNLTKQMREVAVAAQKAQAEFKSLSKATKEHGDAAGLNSQQQQELRHVSRALFDEMAAGQSPLRALSQEFGRIGQILTSGEGGIGGAFKALGALMLRYLPLIGVVAVGAGAAMAFFAGSKAQEDLAKLGEQMHALGMTANQIKGFEIIGAKSGIGAEAMSKGLQEVNKQFESYKKNAGEVKERVELIDKGFLKTLDRTRSLGEFIDALAAKIRTLPRTEGMDLASAAFGKGQEAEEKGRLFYEAIMRGEVGMRQASAAAKAAGINIQDGLVDKLVEFQHKVDEAAAKADGKFKSAMQSCAELVTDIKIKWFEFVEGISTAITRVGELYEKMKHLGDGLPSMGQVIDKIREFAGMSAGQRIDLSRKLLFGIGSEQGTEHYGPYQEVERPTPPPRPGRDVLEPAGKPRARYQAYEDAQKSGGSEASPINNYILNLQKAAETAKAELDSWGKGNLERQKAVALAGAEAAARKEGRELTEEERQKVIELATAEGQYKKQLEDIRALQQEINQAVSSFASTIEQAFESALIRGEKLNQVLKQLLASLASSALKGLLSGALTGDGLVGKSLGLAGQDGQMGGLLGMATKGLLGGLMSFIPGGGLLSGLLNFIPKFDVGTNLVPHDMLAMVHKNEAIVPASQNPAAGAPFSGLGPSINASPNITINHYGSGAPDTRVVSASVMKEIRRGAFLGLQGV